ncbi:hypothetical protein GCM10020001_024280 [Nonomuraea salmonea]
MGGERGQGRQLLGHPQRVAARQDHHTRADLELAGGGQRVRHADQRLYGRPLDQLRQPQRVDPEGLGSLRQPGEVVRGVSRRRRDPDAYLHRPIIAAPVTSPAVTSRDSPTAA